MRGLLAGGVDVLLIETQQDMLAIKCAIAAANIAIRRSWPSRADHGAGVVRSAETASRC